MWLAPFGVSDRIGFFFLAGKGGQVYFVPVLAVYKRGDYANGNTDDNRSGNKSQGMSGLRRGDGAAGDSPDQPPLLALVALHERQVSSRMAGADVWRRAGNGRPGVDVLRFGSGAARGVANQVRESVQTAK